MLVRTKLAPAGLEVVEFDREPFLDDYWDYNPGERVSILGPSGAGKTVLGYQLLEATVSPKILPLVLVSKPNDDTVDEWSKGLGFKVVKDWPPRRNIWDAKIPPGYVVWPPEDPENYQATLNHQSAVFERAIHWAYNFLKREKGKPKEKRLDGTIVFADELQAIDDELNLGDLIVRHYGRGRSNKSGMWGATQLPIDVPGIVYSSADHLFLAYMPDARYRKRFSEIGGGVDTQLIDQTCLMLPQYWWLYIRRSDRTICIIRA
jgi:hypothetical protein